MADHVWTVVLAAGAGRRLASVTGQVPKQFWRSGGAKSLLEETTDRFAPLAPPSRTVVIVDRTHRDHVPRAVSRHEVGTVVYQPEDRGTAAGALLALSPVLEVDSDAVVMITPADHGVVDERRFRRGLVQAARLVRSNGGIVLFGVEPTEAREDYGWITPGHGKGDRRLRRVVSFVEKPSAELARRLFASGAVWNTMVTVGRACAIRDLYADALPHVAETFDAALRLPPGERAGFLWAVYPSLPSSDFSRDVLTPARNLSTYIWPASVGWSDLGTPDRLHAWHRRVGKRLVSADSSGGVARAGADHALIESVPA
jgi:mannose-1-phosphate guanylyltransferase